MRVTDRFFGSFLAEYLRRFRFPVMLGIFAILSIDIVELLLPLVFKELIDHLSAGRTLTHFAPGILRHWLPQGIPFLPLLIFIVFIQVFSRYFWRITLVGSSIVFAGELRGRLLRSLFALLYPEFEKRKVGTYMTHMTSDVENIRMALGPGIVGVVDSFFYCSIIPVVMWSLDPKLTVAVLASAFFIPFVVLFLQKKISSQSNQVQHYVAELGTGTQDLVAGIRVARLNQLENIIQNRLGHFSREVNRSQVSLLDSQIFLGPGLEIFLSIGLVCCLGFGMGASPGVIVAFQRLLQKLMWPMSAIGLAVTYFQKAKASYSDFLPLLNGDKEPGLPDVSSSDLAGVRSGGSQESPRGKSIEPLRWNRARFGHLGFKAPVFDENLYPGSWLGVSGPVGVGKSTLIHGTLGLAERFDGDVFYKGESLSITPIHRWRSHFGTVYQEPYFFKGPLSDQFIRKDRAYLEEIFEICGVGAWASFSSGRELGERGIGVSGGQRQRLGLARALALGRSILLVDDALSSVDGKTAQAVLKSLKSYTSEKKIAVLWLSHQKNHLDWCDRVVSL